MKNQNTVTLDTSVRYAKGTRSASSICEEHKDQDMT